MAALDAWLGSYEKGWTYQNFLAYSQGRGWNSHTVSADGFRPCPAWLAMALRNRYASGDMMRVAAGSMPSLRHGKETYPLFKCAGFRDSRRWPVFVLSRKLNAKYDGQDLGDGYTPVILHLPFKRCGKITLHKLAGDPRLGNWEKMNIEIQSQEVPVSELGECKFAVNERSGGRGRGRHAARLHLSLCVRGDGMTCSEQRGRTGEYEGDDNEHAATLSRADDRTLPVSVSRSGRGRRAAASTSCEHY